MLQKSINNLINFCINVYYSFYKLFIMFILFCVVFSRFIYIIFKKIIYFLDPRLTKNHIENSIENIKSILNNKIILKSTLLVSLTLMIIFNSFSWFYDEYVSNGGLFKVGTLVHSVKEYDKYGNYLGPSETNNLIFEEDLSNTSINTKYIEIENIGTLDFEYALTFQLDGTVSDAGILYYRIYDVTDEVNSSIITENNETLLKSYAFNHLLTSNFESDTSKPVKNLSQINKDIQTGTIKLNQDNDKRYYRLDYGVYQAVNSDLYSDRMIAVHTQVHSTQIGKSKTSTNKVWIVNNDFEFREAINQSINNDTIKLNNNISVEGNISIPKLINIDTNNYSLNITGDLVYDFVENGKLTIDTTLNGKININGDFYLNIPKTEVHLIGENQGYDIYVGKDVTFNCLQDNENDGILLNNIHIVKNTSTLISADIFLKSNTRLTIGHNVSVGTIKSVNKATNIEIINNGNVVQINLENMTLIESFLKPQIYVYNLGTIYGILGQKSIIVPNNATPYIKQNVGNTLIIKGITSSDISVGGSDKFDDEDITQTDNEKTVIPLTGENNAYIVYIRQSNASVETLLNDYFLNENVESIATEISNIKKLIINTVNGQYVENEDFDFLRSSKTQSLEYLDLNNSRVIDNDTIGRIKNNALRNKISITTLLLPNTLTEIGNEAFYNIPLGHINGTKFQEQIIPATVNHIGSGAFNNTEYIFMEGLSAPNIEENAFSSQTIIFVSKESLNNYREINNLLFQNIRIKSTLTDDQKYFVYNVNNGVAISAVVDNNFNTIIDVPSIITINNNSHQVRELGLSSYRNISSNNATLSIPESINYIGESAFEQISIKDANLNQVTYLGKNSFMNTNLENIYANNIIEIDEYALYNTKIKEMNFPKLEKLGKYALAHNSQLAQLNLSVAYDIGDYAVYDCPKLVIVYLNNKKVKTVGNIQQLDMNVGENAFFSNWGSEVDGRLRVYVPDDLTNQDVPYLNLYHEYFSEQKNYIFEKGIFLGNYQHGESINLGLYTVKEIYLNNNNQEQIKGYKIISYQGPNLVNSSQIPNTLTLNSELDTTITTIANWGSTGEYYYQYDIEITNNGNQTINSWELNLELLSGVEITTWWNVEIENHETYAIFKNNSNNGTINPKETITISGQIKANRENFVPVIINANGSKNVDGGTFPVISIGKYAYTNSITNPNNYININNKSVLKVEDNAFLNTDIKTIKFSNLLEIGSNSFSNNKNLYEINLGQTKNMAENAISNNESLVKIIFNQINPEKIHPNSITNNGTKFNNYLRIYVPNNQDAINLYKTKINNNPVFPLGEQVGTYTLPNTNYNIGIHNIRKTEKSVTGIEIIDYHGPKIDSNYNIPTELTYNQETYPVISLGEESYRYTNIDPTWTLQNDTLKYLGDKSFYEQNIKIVQSQSIEEIGISAFENSNINEATLPNLKKLNKNAFLNSEKIYLLNIGKVTHLEEGSLKNTINLQHLYFDNKENINIDEEKINITIASNALENAGLNTGNRFRIYVPNGKYENITYTDLYKNTLPNYSDYIFEKGILYGQYYFNNSTYNMGIYNLLETTQDNITGYKIIDYHGNNLTNNYEIPANFTINNETKQVLEIGNSAFKNVKISNNNTLSLTFPESIKKIGNHSFYNVNLYKVIAPGITTIGDSAFENSAIVSFTGKNVSNIGKKAFKNSNLRTIYLEKINLIDDEAFAYLKNFMSLNLEALTPPTLNGDIFKETLDISKTSKETDQYIFVPNGKYNVYKSDAGFKKYQNYLNSMHMVYDNYIYNFINENEIEIIGYLYDETNIEIPNVFTINEIDYKITSLGSSILDNINVEEITIPQHVAMIEDDFLSKNYTIKNINVNQNNDYFTSINGVLYNKEGTMLVKYPNGKTNTNYTISNNTIIIGNNAFSNNSNLTEITCNEKLIAIANNSFKNMINLKTINFSSELPPYLLGYNTIPINEGFKIKVNEEYFSNYINRFDFYKYRLYIETN